MYDKDFLNKLYTQKNREVFARITVLSFDETPLECIEGKITTGSISIDGASAVRRTCSLTMIVDGFKITDYYWGIKNKIKLEVGLKNESDIIWFPQGIYALTTFNISQSKNQCMINLSGKDKMCFLNGDLGGNLTASVDFGTEEYYDVENNITTYTKIPIRTIIYEALHAYGNEPYANIIINDLDEIAVELLEYRGDTPLYLMRNAETDQFTNYTLNGDATARPEGTDEEIKLVDLGEKYQYDSRVELAQDVKANEPTIVYFGVSPIPYTVARVEYGQTVGYRKTDLTYAGDLVASIGESITSVLDKIVAMLGNYEYFYDLNGRFTFQRKKTYVQSSWNSIVKTNDDYYAENKAFSSPIEFTFTNQEMISSFQNSPALTNLRNDYSVWGERENASGAKIPIHYRYAIDEKPIHYRSVRIADSETAGIEGLKGQGSKDYYADQYDWRELIYQMALDYFKYNQLDCYTARLIEANPELCRNGSTGYEQYYTDMQGFWRQLYDIEPLPDYATYTPNDENYEFEANTDLFIDGRYYKIASIEGYNPEDLYVLRDGEMFSAWDAIILSDWDNTYSNYYLASGNGDFVKVSEDRKDYVNKTDLFVDQNGEYISIFEKEYADLDDIKMYRFDTTASYVKVIDLDDENLKNLYYENGKYKKYLYHSQVDRFGNVLSHLEKLTDKIEYYAESYKYITDPDNEYQYWTTDLVDNPALLNFWFDFLDGNSELEKYSVKKIGDRTKVVNDTNIKAIYFREVPNLIFLPYEENYQPPDGYTPVFIQGNLENLFSISAQGKSAQDKLDDLLYQHSYCVENITLQGVPIYTLEPNVRIKIEDENSDIDGEYIVNKISLPLTYNGLMTISANKAPERII